MWTKEYRNEYKIHGEKERNMKDRLIELLEKADETIMGFTIDGDLGRLADHLLANGVVVPSVKIGSNLFALRASGTKIITFVVTHLEVCEGGVKIYGRSPYLLDETWICWEADLGDNEFVFTTKAEAEKALAERKKV